MKGKSDRFPKLIPNIHSSMEYKLHKVCPGYKKKEFTPAALIKLFENV